jgi:hypothetical protein
MPAAALRRSLRAASRCLLLASPAAYVGLSASPATRTLLPIAHADAARSVRTSAAPARAPDMAGPVSDGGGGTTVQWLLDRLLATNNQFAQGGITLMAVGAALAAARSLLLLT